MLPVIAIAARVTFIGARAVLVAAARASAFALRRFGSAVASRATAKVAAAGIRRVASATRIGPVASGIGRSVRSVAVSSLNTARSMTRRKQFTPYVQHRYRSPESYSDIRIDEFGAGVGRIRRGFSILMRNKGQSVEIGPQDEYEDQDERDRRRRRLRGLPMALRKAYEDELDEAQDLWADSIR